MGLKTETLFLDKKGLEDLQFVKEIEIDDYQLENLDHTPILEIDSEYSIENFSYKFRHLNGRVVLGVVQNGRIKVIDENELRKQVIKPRNVEQLFFANALFDPFYDVLAINARAGSGKTILALSSAMALVRKKEFSRIVYIRNSIESLDKGEEVGFLSQPLHCKVLTPSGWKKMGDMKIGDEVQTPSGQVAKVKTVSPITEKMSYKIECSDGSVTYASGEHLWEFELNKETFVKTTLEIKEKLENNEIFLPETVFGKRKRVVKITENIVEKVQCIGLDDERHLYITDDYIPTHNSGNSEKFAVYNHPLYDSLDFILREMKKKSNANKKGVNKESEEAIQISEERMEEVISQYGIETMWVGELRGRTIHNAFVIVDEAQNISDKTMKTILTRVADDCKVVVIGSLRQIDNIYLNKHTSSLTRLLSKMDRNFENVNAYSIELNKVVRGKITEWAESEIFGEN
jgi:predicted ribonuclease YlaK